MTDPRIGGNVGHSQTSPSASSAGGLSAAA